MKKSKAILFVILFFVSGFLYYFLFTTKTEASFNEEEVIVKRVLDGDTFEISDGRKVRMIGVNTPEKGKFFSNESLSLMKILENKTIKIVYKEKDKYGRILAYVFFEGMNFNKKLLEEGLAHIYYYGKDVFFDEMDWAESKAREDKRGIWKDSPNKGCISLLNFSYVEKTKRCNNEEVLVLENKCNKTINIIIKDDSTKQFEESIREGVFKKNFSCVFNDAGDSLYIWDKEGLILFYRYP